MEVGECRDAGHQQVNHLHMQFALWIVLNCVQEWKILYPIEDISWFIDSWSNRAILQHWVWLALKSIKSSSSCNLGVKFTSRAGDGASAISRPASTSPTNAPSTTDSVQPTSTGVHAATSSGGSGTRLLESRLVHGHARAIQRCRHIQQLPCEGRGRLQASRHATSSSSLLRNAIQQHGAHVCSTESSEFAAENQKREHGGPTWWRWTASSSFSSS